METILNWMRNNESKFNKNSKKSTRRTKNGSKRNNNGKKAELTRNAHPSSRINKNSKKVSSDKNDTKGTLDYFMGSRKKSKESIFDDAFGLADFHLLTKRWNERNAIKE